MGDEQGYDDQFNDGLFRKAVHISQRERPAMWPTNVTGMRRHTSHEQGGGAAFGRDTAHSNYRCRGQVAQQTPLYQQGQPRPYKPSWQGRGWWHHDPARGGWSWVDSGAR